MPGFRLQAVIGEIAGAETYQLEKETNIFEKVLAFLEAAC